VTLLGSDSDIMDDEDEPVLDTVNVIHDGAVNRLRVRWLRVHVYTSVCRELTSL